MDTKKKNTLIEEYVEEIPMRRERLKKKGGKFCCFLWRESADFACQFITFKNHIWYTLIKLLVTMNRLTFFSSLF